MEKKYRLRIWLTIGLTALLLIIMITAWVFLLVKPQNTTIAQTQANYEQRLEVAKRLDQALKEQKKAEDEKVYLQGQVAFFRGRYRHLTFRDIDGTSVTQIAARNEAWRSWMNEYYNNYGASLKRELIVIANSTGVIIDTSIKVAEPPQVPEALVVPANGLLKPTTEALKVTLTGTMTNIMRFFTRLNDSSILMVVDKDLKLDGNSPEIKATFSVIPYLVASGPGVKLTATGGGSSTPAAGAGGAPGMPPGMPGPGGGPGGAPAPPPPPAAPSGGGGGGGEE